MPRSHVMTIGEEDSPPPFELIDHTSPIDSQRSLSLPQLLSEEQRLDPLHPSELGLPSEDAEEQLPDYEPPSLPLYEDDRLETPIACYSLCQSGKLHMLRPADQQSMRRPWYNIVHRSSPSIFSKKADMTLVRLTGTGRRDSAIAEEQKGDEVATMNFDKSCTLPWMPRACVSLGHRSQYKMSAPNFNDWQIIIGDKPLFWGLSTRPWSLVLLDRPAEEVVARFIYSNLGTDAQKGAEVGKLEVYSGYGTEDENVVELILASCQIAIQHWKSMGRHYRNDERAGRGSVATIMSSSSRASRVSRGGSVPSLNTWY